MGRFSFRPESVTCQILKKIADIWEAIGREAVKQLPTIFRSAFPDFKVTIDDVIAEGDKVAVRSTWSGTPKGEFMGIAPTGKIVSFGVFDIMRIAGGKMVEHWGQMDEVRMMQQLGAVLPAAQPGSATLAPDAATTAQIKGAHQVTDAVAGRGHRGRAGRACTGCGSRARWWR